MKRDGSISSRDAAGDPLPESMPECEAMSLACECFEHLADFDKLGETMSSCAAEASLISLFGFRFLRHANEVETAGMSSALLPVFGTNGEASALAVIAAAGFGSP